MSIKSGNVTKSRSELTLSQRLEESARLSRFFSKLLGEALHLQADSIFFAATADGMTVTMRQDKSILKSINIKTSWFNPICNWLSDRFLVMSDEPRPDSWVIDRENEKFDFTACVRVGDGIAIFSVKATKGVGGNQSLHLSGLRTIPRERAIDRLGMSGATRMIFDKLIAVESGIVVIASPDSDQLLRNRAVILSLTSLNYGGDVAETGIRADLPELSRAEIILISARADDATDALLKLKEFNVDVRGSNIAGALCQGFIRRTCPACARKATIDKKLLAQVPPSLIPTSWDGYVVGRGCESCGHRGQLGLIGVQSAISVNDDIRALLQLGSNQEDLLEVAYPLSTRSLLEDGMTKVLAGAVTFEALSELTKFLPAAYNTHLSRLAEPTGGGVPRSVVNSDPDGNSPLFKFGPTGKARAKPLILVVEDDPDQRAILDMVFKASNYEVVLAANGVQALEKLRADIPDLIITDLMMPEMDGTELVTKLKADTAYRKIPVLVLTVVSDGDKEYMLLDLGADDYCEKTVQRKILLKRVENLVKRNRVT